MRLAARLRREIAEGTLAPGMPTPSITTLSQQYGHARQTCAKALRTLEDEGLLTRIPGLGYYVTGTTGAHVDDRDEDLTVPFLGVVTQVAPPSPKP